MKFRESHQHTNILFFETIRALYLFIQHNIKSVNVRILRIQNEEKKENILNDVSTFYF